MKDIVHEIKCKHCGRFLGETKVSTVVTIKCSNSKCKKLEKYRIEFLSDHLKEKKHG